MKKRLLTLMAMVMALGLVFAAGPVLAVNDAVTYTLDNPQQIVISTPANSSDAVTLSSFVGDKTISVAWTVTSNNGFDVSFTGTSQDDSNSALSYPQFSKQDQDASDAVVASKYDNMTTTFGVVISGHESVQSGASWCGGATPTGTSANLVLGLGVTDSPDLAIGTIMPSDADGTAVVTLHAKGAVAGVAQQSGDYTATVTCTVAADESL